MARRGRIGAAAVRDDGDEDGNGTPDLLGATVDAIMIYSSAGQVAAILPSSTPEGDGT